MALCEESRRENFSPDDGKRERYNEQLRVLRREIDRCWRKYEARNPNLAYLAANVLLLLAMAQGYSLITGESRKSTGRGLDAKGRWRNWRNNGHIRGELWRILRYKCHLIRNG